jgi:RNA polymerase sigma factor (sigma-70 family)
MTTTETMPDTVERNDADLVADSLAGRRDAFRQIVERYQTLVCSLAYNATGDVRQSEDVAQETFISAWKDLRLLRQPEKLRAWLCGIVRNQARRRWRDEGREPVSNAVALDDANESAAGEALPSEQAVSREEEAILWRSIARIPENYREPLILFYREHQSIENVAAALELSEDAVKQRLSRGRKLLQEEVQAFVENTLRRTAPGHAFSGAVLAALPMAAGATAGAGVSLGAKGTAAAKSGLLAAWFLPAFGILAGFAVQWTMFGSGRSGRVRRNRRIGIIVAWVSVLTFSIGGQLGMRWLGQRWGWNERAFFSAMTWFWWFYATVIATWTVGAYRFAQAIRQPDAAAGNEQTPAAAPMKPVMRMFAALGTNLMLFSGVIALAWGAHDRIAAAVIVGVMLALSVWHFFLLGGKTGKSPELVYIPQLASSCAAMLAIVNLRFDTWAACWYSVSVAELHLLVPLWMVPLLTAVLAVWAGVLLFLTRPRFSTR